MSSGNRVVISNFSWKLLERILAQVASLLTMIILARILTPDDFGIVSLVAIFFSFANILISGGLNTALIQKKDTDYLDYSTVFHVSIILSIAVYIVLFFCAPLIAKIYANNELIIIIRVMGLTLPVTAFKSIWCSYISSSMQFRKFFFATLGGTIASTFVGIFLALKGFGAWALVAQQMTNTLIDTAILFFSTKIHIVFKIDKDRFKHLFKYGIKILISNLIGNTYAELVPLVIGVKFSSADLSFYKKGQTFSTAISSTITSTFSAVFFPLISKVQENKEKVLYYTRTFMKISSLVIFPCMLGFFAIASDFVYLVLTDKWMNTVFFIRVFAICGMFDIIAVGNCETIKAIGKSGTYLIIEIIKKVLYFSIIVLFLVFAKEPKLLAISSIACTCVQVIVNSIPNKKLINYRIIDQIKDVLPSLLCSAIMCIIVMLSSINNVEFSTIGILRKIAIGISSYLFLSLMINPDFKKLLHRIIHI